MRRFALVLAILLAVPAVAGGTATDAAGSARDYIVRYKESAVASDRASVRVASRGPGTRVRGVDRAKVERRVRKARSWGIRPRHVFRHGIGGFAARLSPGQVRRLRDDPSVASIEIDAPVAVADRVEGGVISRGEFGRQQVPTGIRRIYADRQPLAHIGERRDVDVDIAVLDTGIAKHPDLRIGGGYNCSAEDGRDPSKYTDRYGHGTHVAGTIAARDNSLGVVGVVPGARVWAIKVLGDKGTGKTSDIVCGLQWMIGQQLSSGGPRFIAANMSIAGPQQHPVTACGNGTSDTYHQLMCQAMDAGIVFAVAAANDHRVVNQRPAIFDEPITVAALVDYDGRPGGRGRQRDVCPWYSTDSDDTWANFSNWGAAVDIVAPGKCILSTFKPGGGKARYAWMSGTSMATPHVTGAIALYRLRYPDALPQQVKQALASAGTRDWRTGSAPDGRPYRLLQVRSLTPPPTFAIASVRAPSVPLGGEGAERGVRVTLTRRDGHYRSVRVSVSRPDAVGSETLRIGERSRTGTLMLQGTRALQSGTVEVTVRATDGELTSTHTVRVPVDADPPVVTIQTPTGSTIFQALDERTIRATSSDSGTGIARRTLLRRRAPQSEPMSCDDVTWRDDGSARTVTGSGPWTSGALRSGYCYRWYVTAHDGAGNATTARSAVVWTDVSAPQAPAIEVSGDGVARGSTVWFRPGGPGRITLGATSSDPHSGLNEAVIGSLSGGGWSTTSSSTLIAQQATSVTVSRAFAFTSAAGPASVTIRATNGVDRSRRSTVAFRPDASAPSLSVTTPTVLTWLGSPETRIRYEASDSGAGLAGVSARRQRTDLRSEAEGCATSWQSDGSQVPVGSRSFSVDGLERGYCYRWVITATDRLGHARTRTTAAVAIDPTRPVVDQVRVTLDRSTVRTSGSVPVRISWRLRTEPRGDTSFDLARSTDGGDTWGAIDHPRGTHRSQDTTLANGSPTTISVRGRSTTGATSSWAVSRRITARLVQEDASGVTTSRGWRRVSWSSASGGHRLVSSRKGAKVTYRFDGEAIGLVAARGRDLGTATIRIDGKVAASLDLHRSPTGVRQVVWTRALGDGRHTISVEVRSGTVVVDGFVVMRSATGDDR